MEELTEEQEVRPTNKRIQAPKTHSTAEMYVFFKQKFPKDKTPYWMFKEVLARYNKKASDAVIYGQVFRFGQHLGNLLIKKIRRNYEKAVVDWGESKRVKAELVASGLKPREAGSTEGNDWLIYHSDPWYLRWGWQKRSICKVTNQAVYKFIPTANRSKTAGDNSPAKLGNKGKLVLANRLNPTLHLLYDMRISKKE